MPELPEFEVPVLIVTEPVLPELAVPVATLRAPLLCWAYAPSAVRMEMTPLVVALYFQTTKIKKTK